MSAKKVAAMVTSVGAGATALLGSSAFSDNKWVTGTALALIAFSQLLAHTTVENTNDSLHNGTFQKLIKSALLELAKENGVPLEIQDNHSEDDSEKGGNFNG